MIPRLFLFSEGFPAAPKPLPKSSPAHPDYRVLQVAEVRLQPGIENPLFQVPAANENFVLFLRTSNSLQVGPDHRFKTSDQPCLEGEAPTAILLPNQWAVIGLSYQEPVSSFRNRGAYGALISLAGSPKLVILYDWWCKAAR